MVFLPCYWKKYKSRNVRLRLLFRNYIFFSIPEAKLWPEIAHCTGILSVMTHKYDDKSYDMPQTIDAEAIETLRAQALGFDEVTGSGAGRPQFYISPGCHVRIISGPFMNEAGADRALVEWSDENRATLLMSIFNRQTKVQFHLKDLELLTT